MPLNGDFNLFEDDDGSGWIVYNSDKNGHLCGACHISPCDCGAETPVSRHFRPKSLNICPDRLGANIGKVEKNHVSAGFQMSVERLTADFTASGADAIFLFHVPMVRVVENEHLPRQAQDCHHVCKSSLQTLVFLSQR